MSKTEIENLIIGSIHGAFTKYPEGDGGPNLDYEWIATDQSAQIAKLFFSIWPQMVTPS